MPIIVSTCDLDAVPPAQLCNQQGGDDWPYCSCQVHWCGYYTPYSPKLLWGTPLEHTIKHQSMQKSITENNQWVDDLIFIKWHNFRLLELNNVWYTCIKLLFKIGRLRITTPRCIFHPILRTLFILTVTILTKNIPWEFMYNLNRNTWNILHVCLWFCRRVLFSAIFCSIISSKIVSHFSHYHQLIILQK